MVADHFWTESPINILLNEYNFFPCMSCSTETNLNRVTRFILIVCIISAIVMRSTRFLYLGIMAIVVTAAIYNLSSRQMDKFSNYNPNVYNPAPSFHSSPYNIPFLNYGVGPQVARLSQNIMESPNPTNFWKNPNLRAPTVNNPFMNVSPLDYDTPPFFDGYEKITYPGNVSQNTRANMKSDFEKGLFQDASGRLWERENSQRQFVSQPVGSVPSDQAEYANWLYGNNKVCKSGSIWDRYGVAYTDDSLVCNGFNVSSPTNHGILNENGLMSSVEQNN